MPRFDRARDGGVENARAVKFDRQARYERDSIRRTDEQNQRHADQVAHRTEKRGPLRFRERGDGHADAEERRRHCEKCEPEKRRSQNARFVNPG